MYSANDLKQDLLVNINGNSDFPTNLHSIMSNCEFQFNDSGEFTRIVWNTFKRNLIIFCPAEARTILEENKVELYRLCDSIHGQKDDFLLMSMEIIAKSDLSSTRLTDSRIQIKTEVIIDRTEENEIGKGGFGKVYKYYDNVAEEMYAYKIYEPSVFQESSPEIMKKRFVREGKKLLHYSHENVVKAYDYGFLGDESAFIKLEYITGLKLIDHLKTNSLSVEAREDLCHQYISAMAYVHSKSDMHRDISYSNIMVDVTGKIKVLDFGFVRGNDDAGYDTIYKDIVHKFALPDETYGIKTEVYCIGAILFSIITNEEFNREELHRLDSCECDSILIDITRKCLSLSPNERFNDAKEIQEVLFSNTTVVVNAIKDVEFNLDDVRDNMLCGVKIYFSCGDLPTIETIKNWIEVDLKEVIECHMFLSQISIFTFLNKLPHIDSILKYANRDYMFPRKTFENMYKFYNQLPDKMKSIFIKNVYIIMLEHSYESEELPFN